MSIAEFVLDIAEGFDDAREELLGADAKLVLLKVNGKNLPYDLIATITSGWFPKFKEFFGISVFRIADISAATAAKIRQASHVMVIDSEVPALNNVLFEGDGKSQPPLGTTAYWAYTATSLKRTYFAPEEV